MSAGIIDLSTGERTRVVDTGGSGVPLLFVHGLGNSLEIWDRVVPAFADVRCVAFDLPGFGEASRPDAAYDGPFFARQIVALLDALGIERAIPVGNSLGASALLHLGDLAPERIERAVLAAPGGIGPKTNLLMRAAALPLVGGWLVRPTPTNNRRTLKLALHDLRHLTGELIERFDRQAAMPGAGRAFVRTLQAGVTLSGTRDSDRTRTLARCFPVPTLVVWGHDDKVFPSRYAREAADLIPDARLTIIDACGHYPQWEQPAAFAAAVREFVL